MTLASIKKPPALWTAVILNLVGREGFEPPKAEPVDLQSTPFDRFGTYPHCQSVYCRSSNGIIANCLQKANHSSAVKIM